MRVCALMGAPPTLGALRYDAHLRVAISLCGRLAKHHGQVLQDNYIASRHKSVLAPRSLRSANAHAKRPGKIGRIHRWLLQCVVCASHVSCVSPQILHLSRPKRGAPKPTFRKLTSKAIEVTQTHFRGIDFSARVVGNCVISPVATQSGGGYRD